MKTDTKPWDRTILKRPLWVVVAITGQFLIAAYLIYTDIFLLQSGAGLSVLIPEPLLGAISAVALLRKGDWGWWLALITDLLWVVILFYEVVRASWAMLWHTATITMAITMRPATVFVLLLLPSVKSFYLRKTNIQDIRITPF